MRARLPDLARAQDVDSHRSGSPQASMGEFQLIAGLVVRVLFDLVAFFLMTSNPATQASSFISLSLIPTLLETLLLCLCLLHLPVQ